MPACSICSRSAKHAHMTVIGNSYNFCSTWCMDVGLKQINAGLPPAPHESAICDAVRDMEDAYGGADFMNMTKDQALHFCREALLHYQYYATRNLHHKFIPSTYEEAYIREACLPAVGKLPVITIESAVPAIIDAFRKECENEIPW